MNLKQKSLEFLHKWLNDRKLTIIKVGMVEELEAFVNDILSQQEISRVTNKMIAQKPALEDTDSKEKDAESGENE